MAQKLYEESNIQAIANAIRSKLGISSKMRTSEMASKINSISSGGSSTGVDTSDANAKADNIEAGRTAYVKGEKITGTLPLISEFSSTIAPRWDEANQRLVVSVTNDGKRIFNETKIELRCLGEKFGDATAADVAAGKTFTSAEGLMLTGTAASGASGGVVRKTGSFTIDANSESYTFSTGLSKVHSVMVRGNNSSNVNNTFAWYYDDAQTVGLCAYTSKYVTGHTTTPNVSISGGDVTCNQYSSNYPIVNKTFKWVAYGE